MTKSTKKNQMKLKEYLEQFDTNIFQEMKLATDLGYFDVFKDTDVVLMNHILLLTAGERNVRQSIQTLPLNVLARILITDYSNSWNNIATLDLKINGSFADEINIHNEEGKSQVLQTNNANNTNKVSAYDTDELVIDDGSTSDGSSDINNTNSGSSVDEKYILANIYDNLDKSQQFKIHRKVINDIVNTITLSVY